MIVDLSCPIELRSYELLSDDFGNIRAYIRLHNLTNKKIVGYAATINWYNAITRARITENIAVDECGIEPEDGFKLVHSTQNLAKIDHVEMYFSSVTFDDGTEWKPGSGDLIEIGEQQELTGARLDRLRELAGEDAVQYPQVQKEYWRCVCGRINYLKDEKCVRCRRDRNRVLKQFNQRAVMRNHNENAGGKASRRKTQAQKKHAWQGILYLLLALLLLAILAFAGFHLGRDGREIFKEGFENFDYGFYSSAYSFSNISSL
ncbi:MAG: hypothetical protein IIW08_02665 [Clostridia bacterium]|nr:hypothetical protein [Clostridia bacterium]MBQ2434458.1 hypothetical protein [Clostridia bacterium]MBQ5770059.1 hypothetical protein [Clostridia bacterium]